MVHCQLLIRCLFVYLFATCASTTLPPWLWLRAVDERMDIQPTKGIYIVNANRANERSIINGIWLSCFSDTAFVLFNGSLRFSLDVGGHRIISEYSLSSHDSFPPLISARCCLPKKSAQLTEPWKLFLVLSIVCLGISDCYVSLSSLFRFANFYSNNILSSSVSLNVFKYN